MSELHDLLGKLEDPDEKVYKVVQEEIWRFRKEAIEPLLTLLQNPNKLLRSRAADLFYHLAWEEVVDDRTIPPLVKCLTDEELSVRTSAAWALSKILPEALGMEDMRVEAVNPLIALLHEANQSARTAAAWVLIELLGFTNIDEYRNEIFNELIKWLPQDLEHLEMDFSENVIADEQYVESLIDWIDRPRVEALVRTFAALYSTLSGKAKENARKIAAMLWLKHLKLADLFLDFVSGAEARKAFQAISLLLRDTPPDNRLFDDFERWKRHLSYALEICTYFFG